MKRDWDICKSPDSDDELDIELDENKKLILEHYKETGEFCEPQVLKKRHSESQSPSKKEFYSPIEKIQEVEEEESNLQSKKQIYQIGEFMIHTFARPAISETMLNTRFSDDENYQKMKMKLEKQFQVKEENLKREANELLNRLKLHQKFIIELIFSLNLAERLENDLDSLLTTAQGNFIKYKQNLQQKQIQEAARLLQQKQEKQKAQRERIEKQKLQMEKLKREREENQRFQKQRTQIQKISLRNSPEKQRGNKQSPTKLFKPLIKGLEFAHPRRSYIESGSSTQSIKRSFIENKNVTVNYLPLTNAQNQSPTKIQKNPKTSPAFERRKSYIPASPQKQGSSPASVQNSFQIQLQQKLKLISQGRSFKRICYLTMTTDLVDIYCSQDYKRLIFRFQNFDTISEPMNDFLQVSLGRTTKNNPKYPKNGQTLQDGVSFSIIFSKRIIDLQSFTTKQRGQFIQALYQLRRMAQY